MEFTNLKQDSNYKQDYSSRNFKTLKHQTNNYNDPTINLDKLITFQNQFASASNNLRYSEVVSSRQKTIVPPLPLLTTPSLIRGKGNTDIEDSLRGNHIRDRKTCNPKHENYYNRTFQIFDTMPVVYNTPETPFTQAEHSLRGGIDTHSVKYTYTNHSKKI